MRVTLRLNTTTRTAQGTTWAHTAGLMAIGTRREGVSEDEGDKNHFNTLHDNSWDIFVRLRKFC